MAGLAGQHRVTQAQQDEQMGAPFGQRILELAELDAGDRVLAVGCGNGALSIKAGHRAQPDGAVVGVDISEQMLTVATERAATAGRRNVTFLHADAQIQRVHWQAFIGNPLAASDETPPLSIRGDA